jgi:hypothetical protein
MFATSLGIWCLHGEKPFLQRQGPHFPCFQNRQGDRWVDELYARSAQLMVKRIAGPETLLAASAQSPFRGFWALFQSEIDLERPILPARAS